MIHLSKSFVLYGRVEPAIFKHNNPYAGKRPGYQVVSAANELTPKDIEELTLAISMDAGETVNHWEENGGADHGLWSFGILNDSFCFVSKSLILTDREVLDRNGRQTGITHAVLLSDRDMRYISYNPFLLIDSNAPLFISSIDDVIELANPNNGNGDAVLSQTFELDKSFSSSKAYGFEEEYNKSDLVKVLRYINHTDRPVTVRGTTAEFLDLLRQLFDQTAEAYRKQLGFSMLCARDRKSKVRFQPGKISHSQFGIDAETKTLNIPASLEEEGFFFESNQNESQLTIHDLTSRYLGQEQLQALLSQPLITVDDVSSVNETEIERYLEENSAAVREILFTCLSDVISPPLANQITDYAMNQAYDAHECLFNLIACKNSNTMFRSVLDLIYEFLAYNLPHLPRLVDTNSWKSLHRLCKHFEHLPLSFLMSAVVWPSKSRRDALLSKMTDEQFRSLMFDYRFLPPTILACHGHAKTLLSKIQTDLFSDKELAELVIALNPKDLQVLTPNLIARIQLMSPKLQQSLQKVKAIKNLDL
ncbi:MAG: hypothetical protein JNK90_08700 [Planctomycetaceae bacterium]|nr:hypothetical protein [Planctomycetaceae bacterium]